MNGNITMTSSIFNAFLECPKAAMAQYLPRITGDKSIEPAWRHPGSQAMACGTLLDAIVTKGFETSIEAKHDGASLAPFLASSYGDGSDTCEWLQNKNGTWNAAAKRTIAAGERLLSDPVARFIIEHSKKQVRVSFEPVKGVTWEGDIDLLFEDGEGNVSIIDLKHPGKVEDGWVNVGGKPFKVAWYDTCQYWFQLAGYLLAYMQTAASNKSIRSGLLYATQESPSSIGYQPMAQMVHEFQDALNTRLPAIREIVGGKVAAPGCGRCGFCRAVSKVELPKNSDIPIHVIDDKFGIAG